MRVVPVVEEEVVVKERWIITKRRVETPGSQVLPLRREEAVVERFEPKTQADSSPKKAR